MKYTTLEGVSVESIFDAFTDAFSGFRITSETTPESFGKMLQESGYVPGMSMGAFDGGTLAGFVLTAPKAAHGSAYIILTGTRGAYRRQGVSRNIFQKVFTLLKENGIASCHTEVKRNNAPAIALYRSLGFDIGPEITTVLKTPAGSREVYQYEIIRYL